MWQLPEDPRRFGRPSTPEDHERNSEVAQQWRLLLWCHWLGQILELVVEAVPANVEAFLQLIPLEYDLFDAPLN